MKNVKEWFSVSTDGFKELQIGKSKTYILRELIQNAFDEPIIECHINTQYRRGLATISVEDDSPIGFRNLTDAYTLFGKTYKRADPHKRGRFNIGEKMCIAISEYAEISTTKGRVIFDKTGRHEMNSCVDGRKKGSLVIVKIKMTEKEFAEINEYAKEILIPQGIRCFINTNPLPYREIYKEFSSPLMTEIERDNKIVKTIRKVAVDLVKPNGKVYLYEMGIPVQDIDCEYSINVQQKIPLTIDRDCVSPAFLQDLYAEVLNQIHTEIKPENSSKLWIRDATSDDRVSKDAVQSVIKQRYGDKVCIANPLDPKSNDDALSKGYKLVYGSEMSGEEWQNIKDNELMKSSSALFGGQLADCEYIEPDEDMRRIGQFAIDLAKRLLGINIRVKFLTSRGATVCADFGNNVLRFNVSRLGKDFFKEKVGTISLIVHEIGHLRGHHTEASYHDCLTDMAQRLVEDALDNPEFFKDK